MEEILKYENLVYSIIKRYAYFDMDDLYQVGMMELIKAKRNFKEDFNIKFSTYAYYYILGGVTKYIREISTIKVSRDLIKLKKSVEKAKEVMRQRLRREPTTLEISLFLEVPEEKIIEAEIATQNIKSLDYCFEEENDDLYNSIKVEDKSMDERLLDLKNAIMDLNEEERSLIIARYFEDLTQTETSKQLGMSQVQVSRKETKILQKLRATL